MPPFLHADQAKKSRSIERLNREERQFRIHPLAIKTAPPLCPHIANKISRVNNHLESI